MPLISQLPSATGAEAADTVPISQGGVAKAVSVGNLLAGVQPAILTARGTLLGRKSLGEGGPEEIAVGAGLVLNEGTLAAAGGDLTALTPISVVTSGDRMIVVSEGALKLAPVDLPHDVYSAGEHITIDDHGVISAAWPGDETGGSYSLTSFSNLPILLTASALDRVPIEHDGTIHAVSHAGFLNGRTIDQVQSAGDPSDSDTLLVGQGGSVMLRQSLGAIWHWMTSRLSALRIPVVEVSTDTTLDATVHNGRILACIAPITLGVVLGNLGSGFHCEIVNLSSGDLMLDSAIMSASGSHVVPPCQVALVRCVMTSAGTTAYAAMIGGTVGPLPPGAPANLSLVSLSGNAAQVTWDPPTSGGSVAGYVLHRRTAETSAWAIVADGATGSSFTFEGLVQGINYEVAVAATNVAGRSVLSNILQIAVPSGAASPGVVTNLSATTQGTSSILLTWGVPTNGGAPTSYTVQYRQSGVPTWSNSVAGVAATTLTVSSLTPGTTYELRVFAMNEGGAGPATAPVSATTLPLTGAVTSVAWNLVPAGPYTAGVGSIGVNARIQPADAAVHFGFSQSLAQRPSEWTAGIHVNTDFWAAYVPTPPNSGSWYAWVEGTDGSAATPYSTPFAVI
ncbi:MAG: fibronectin type III domain-containing protein [Acetobacteraceae bacterium]